MKSRGVSSGRKMTTTPEGSPATRRMAARSGQPRFSLRTPTTSRSVSLMCTRTSGGSIGIQIALDERDVHVLIDVILVATQPKSAVFGVHGLIVNPLHRALVLEPIADEVRDGADLQRMRLGKALEVGAARHGAVVVQDLDDHGGRRKTRRAAPDRIPLPYGRRASARRPGCAIRGNMCPGWRKSSGRAFGAYRGLHGMRAIMSGNSRGHAFGRFDGQGEVGAMRAVGFAHHQAAIAAGGSARASGSGR